jgi:hypothetical protein
MNIPYYLGIKITEYVSYFIENFTRIYRCFYLSRHNYSAFLVSIHIKTAHSEEIFVILYVLMKLILNVIFI